MKTKTTVVKRTRSKKKTIEKKVKRLEAEEAVAKRIWNRAHLSYIKAGEYLDNLLIKISHGDKRAHNSLKSKKFVKAYAIRQGWKAKSDMLTARRDAAREAIAKLKSKISGYDEELARLVTQIEAEKKTTDRIVELVYTISDEITEAYEKRNMLLNEEVFPKLIGKDGQPRSQITFTHSNETMRVVAMTNTITKIVPDLALEAKALIEKFFERIRPRAEMDQVTAKLYDLTRKILVEKTKFTIGPELYLFLSLEVDESIFPELKQAQNLIKKSLRSEKTDKYIRLMTRKNRNSRWEPKKLST